MISRAKFLTCCQESGKIFRLAEILADAIPQPVYPDGMPALMRSLNYRERWKQCINEGWYHYKLDDQSIVQFRLFDQKFSMSYIECPYQFMPFEDFAYDRMGDDWPDFEDDLRQEYEFYMGADVAERSVTPLRYDYEPELYRPGFHPAGHFHVGVDNEIRMAVKNILNPISFSLFVVRQYYPKSWEKLLEDEDIAIICREVRENLTSVDRRYFNHLDDYELIMT